MFKLSEKIKDDKCMKDILSATLCEMGEEDNRVVVFDADLANPSGSVVFGKKFPERFFECGIMEQHMAGAAGGISDSGAVPFFHTFSAFASRKCADQIFMTMCYPKANVKILASDPGITAQDNGGSHQGMEDMGILMGFHNITLMEPADNVMFRWMLKEVKDVWGVHYLRFFRRDQDSIYEEGSTFEIGKANLLKDGTDVTIIASGIEVREALKAAELLAKENISARVVDMFTWKPLDEEMIEKCAKETGAIVVAENHSADNGLGNAVAAAAARRCPVPMEFVGIHEFGEVGDVKFLMERFGLGPDCIAEAAKKAAARKAQ